MSAATGTTASASELDADTRTALRRLVLGLADSKRLLGIRYSDWLLGAPSIETGIAASGMAQDEWGHARLLYAMLKDFGEDPVAIEHDRRADAYCSVDTLDRPFEDWAGVVAAMVVIDGALTVALEAFAEGSYEPARARVPKMVAEEAFHRDLGVAWLRRLASGTDEARERTVVALEAFLLPTVAWLAPADDARDRLTEAGLMAPADRLVDVFRTRYAAALATVGVTCPESARNPEGWDASRGRGPGRPDEDSVERARGDRNRALFVE